MTRLTDLPPAQAQRLAELECPDFATRPWVGGPALPQRRVAIVSSAGLVVRAEDPFRGRAVRWLGHYLEEEGLATVAISLIRPQTERTRPPRALWVPFELGRPFGPPSDPAFQKRVVLAALRLVERQSGPVIIEDFPDDDPRARPDPGWRLPFDHAAVANGSAETIARALETEIARLRGGDA